MNSHHAGEQLREESLGVTSEKFLSAHSGVKGISHARDSVLS